MPIELQKRIIEQIILKRGNTRSESHNTGGIDIEGVFDHLDPTYTLSENISLLESEGFLLRDQDMENYKEKKAMRNKRN